MIKFFEVEGYGIYAAPSLSDVKEYFEHLKDIEHLDNSNEIEITELKKSERFDTLNLHSRNIENCSLIEMYNQNVKMYGKVKVRKLIAFANIEE